MATYTQLSLWEQPKEISNANYRECRIHEGCQMCQYKMFRLNVTLKDWCKLLGQEISIGHTCDYSEEFRR